MDDAIGHAEAMLGLDGFRVLEVDRKPAEMAVTVETTADVAGCATCGVRAKAQDREGSIYSSAGLTRHDELGEARRPWHSPSSTASSAVSSRRSASTGWTRWPRTPRSSCCATS